MNQKKRILSLLALGLIIFSSFFLNDQFWDNSLTKNIEFTENDKSKLKSAKYWPNLDKIRIDDTITAIDWATTAANNDWCNGSGTWSDPYIIKNVIIDGQERESCILINNSNVFFTIENCTVYNSGDDYAFSEEAGIKLENTHNATLINNDSSFNNKDGIRLKDCTNITLSANNINNNGFTGLFCKQNTDGNRIIGNIINNNALLGLWLQSDCTFNNISQNTVNKNFEAGILLADGNNNNISENILNYNNRSGIFIGMSSDNIITKNNMKGCGIGFGAPVNILSSNNITKDNLVNGKAVYFYVNETRLDTDDFNIIPYGVPGQIILIECNNSILSNFDLSQTSVALTMYNCKNNTISDIIANNCTISGLELYNCYNNTIKECSVNYNTKGIGLEVSDFIKIQNNNATNNNWGIGLSNSNYNIINTNNFSKNDEAGIDLQSSTENNITNNYISQNKREGIIIFSSSFNIIRNNTINENINTLYTSYGIGIAFEADSNNNTIIENILSNNSYAGIILSGRNNSISKNNFTNCGLQFDSTSSVFEDFISHNIDITNLVNKKPLYFYFNKTHLDSNNFSDPGQIILVNSNNSYISNFDLSHSTSGISLYYCKNATIVRNNLTDNHYSGLLLVESSHVNVSNNNLNNNLNKFIDTAITYGFGFGILLEDCNNLNITNNNASNNGIGFHIENSKDNRIIDNIIDDNYMGGIVIYQQELGSCDNNNFSGNSMKNCSFYLYPSPNEPLLFIDKSNLVNNKPVHYYYHRDNLKPDDFLNAGQIILSGCSDSVISNLDFFRCSIGVSVLYSDNITINNINSSNNSNYGIMVTLSVNCVITNNAASENVMGIFSYYSDNTIITNNTVKDSKQLTMEAVFQGAGIASAGYNNTIIGNRIINNPIGLLASGMYANVSENQIENNNQYGIFTNNFHNGSLTRNTVINNEIGISVPSYNDNNRIYYNNFIGNGLNSEDNGDNNKWDDGYAGNYWDDYTGIDANADGVGDTTYSIRGLVYNKDNKPLFYPIDVDTDGEGLMNYEEYVLGRDNYRTNVLRSDTDYDELSDYWEWKNSTNPLNNDTDYDNMPDGWEVFNFLNATYGIDNLTDADNDFLLNLYEYLNGTDPNNEDTDGDTFLDGIEVNLGTKPLLKYWYPMPNLAVVDFDVTSAEIGKPFVLNISITNNGIWDVKNITIIIWVEFLEIALYNSTIDSDDPLNLDVDEVFQDFIQSAEVYQGGRLVMELQLDPENIINETYSNKDGSYRYRDGEDDNTLETILDIGGDLPGNGGGNGGIDPLIIILIVIGAVAFAGTVSAYVVIRPRIKKRAAFKKQIENAKKDIDNFEFSTRSFIKTKLTDTYESVWWDAGIPEYIRKTIGTKLKTEKPKKLAFQVDKMNLLDFTHYSSIITYQENWEQIFSKTFPNKSEIETNFENLRLIKRDLNEGTITREQLSTYPLFIHTIRNHFTKGFKVFLSYSTLDTELFNVKEIVKRLETYPLIDRVFFWEEDSGENIVTYMERTLKITKVFVFFCTEHSVRSKAVEDEWQAAFQMRKKGLMKIIPVYENEDIIPFLLMPLLNVKFIKDDFDGFIQKLYEEIIR